MISCSVQTPGWWATSHLLWPYFPVCEVRRQGEGNQVSWRHMPGISPQDSQQHHLWRGGVRLPWRHSLAEWLHIRNHHCENDLKQPRELFSQILGTTSAPNQLLSWKPFISTDLPRLYWQGSRGRGGGAEWWRGANELTCLCKVRSMFTQWPCLESLVPQCHHQVVTSSSI